MGNVSVRDYHPIYDSEMFVSMYPIIWERTLTTTLYSKR